MSSKIITLKPKIREKGFNQYVTNQNLKNNKEIFDYKLNVIRR